MSSIRSTLTRPEYTGERRCWPCTVLNGVVLAVVCGLLAATHRRVAALGVGVVGAAAIAFRGYLVPYTPQFAPRLVEWLPGDPFHTTASSGSLTGEANGEAVLETLVATGVLVPDGEELRLDEDFRGRWHAEMDALRAEGHEALAAHAVEHAAGAVEAEVVTGTGRNGATEDRWVVLADGSGSTIGETWLSIPVAIAEVAAVRALDAGIPVGVRAAAGRPLRMFLEACPRCGGRIERSTEGCCGGYGPNGPDEILLCVECKRRVFTF